MNTSESKIFSGFSIINKYINQHRPLLDKLWQRIFPENVPSHSNLIEIKGSQDFNKSHMLYQLLAYAAIVNNYESINCDTVFIDLMHKFDVDIFVNYYLKPLLNQQEYEAKEKEEILLHILNSITVYNCYSCEELEISLNEIERMLWLNANLGLVFMDGVIEKPYGDFTNILKKLQNICKKQNVWCVYAKRFYNFNDDYSTLMNVGCLSVRHCNDLHIIQERTFLIDVNNTNCLPFLLKKKTK